MRIPDAKLAELEALESVATSAPWDTSSAHDDPSRLDVGHWDSDGRGFYHPVADNCITPDAKLIIALRNSASDLLADLHEANAAIEFSQGVNQSYADQTNAAVARAEKAEAKLREARGRLETECAANEARRRQIQELDGYKANHEHQVMAYEALRLTLDQVDARADKAEAERDRYRDALTKIAAMTWPRTTASKGDALSDALDVARAALEQA